jgi:hypothetical protein
MEAEQRLEQDCMVRIINFEHDNVCVIYMSLERTKGRGLLNEQTWGARKWSWWGPSIKYGIGAELMRLIYAVLPAYLKDQ